MADFALATRKKLRFDTPIGQITTEDLWNLPLQASSNSRANQANLDSLAVDLHRQLEATPAVSFVNASKTTRANEDLQLKFDVVKHIIDVKIAERDAAAAETERAAQKQRIREILANKQDESLMSKSEDELKELLNKL